MVNLKTISCNCGSISKFIDIEDSSARESVLETLKFSLISGLLGGEIIPRLHLIYIVKWVAQLLSGIETDSS